MTDPAQMGAIAWGLVQLCPAESGVLKRRARKAQATRAPYEAIEELARRISTGPAAPWSGDVLRAAEELLATGDPAAVELVTYGLLEDLGNIASHNDSPTNSADLVTRLPPLCRAAWERVGDLWSAAAVHGDATAMTREKYDSVSSPELRATIQCMFRRLADGQLVGLADVIRYEASNGGGPHRGKAG